MQQYFVDDDFSFKNFDLSKDDSFHIIKVMRKKIGDKIFIVFTDKKKYVSEIKYCKNNIVTVFPVEEVIIKTELESKIKIAIPPLKNDKIDYLIQKSTELGVDEIILYNSQRSVSKIKNDKIQKKISRYEKISKEAAEQSKRITIPKIIYYNSEVDLIEKNKNITYKLLAYENEAHNEKNRVLSKILNNDFKNKDFLVVFGCEGGFSKEEINLFINNDYKLIGLGNRILRAETAPLLFLSCIVYFLELN